MQLSEIWIYPIKSLGGIRLTQANILERGLENDRRWMLVDEKGVFLTQRQFAQLALFQPSIQHGQVTVVHRPSNEAISFGINEYLAEQFDVIVWDDTMPANEVNTKVSDWFSKKLDMSVRLVYMPDTTERKVDPQYALNTADITSFSDGYPILIIGQASLDDLNNKLSSPIPINRFRPNFVFINGQPFEEETWHEFTIGTTTFWGVKPCSRCIMTTVDHEKGEKTGKDPLYTLSKYRKVGNKILFGQNLLIGNTGTVTVGDAIVVQSTRVLPKFKID